MKRLMSMREALSDPEVFATILPGETWAKWRIILIASQGEPLTPEEREIYATLTGREREPDEPVDELWGICGRGAGKTRAFSVAGAYYAGCVDHTGGNLAPGQRYRLPVMAQTASTAKEAYNYLLGIFQEVPMFADMLDGDPTQDTIRLTAPVDIMVTPANFKTARGPTLIAAICDEIAFWHLENAANPDKEILRALRPGLARVGGPLFVLSSPYARKGELYAAYKREFGPKGDPRIVVFQAPTLTMNSSSKALEREVARAYERDPEAAKAEYGALFRDGISDFVSAEVVEGCTDAGITHRDPENGQVYFAFIDPAGGSGQDSMTLAIAHKEGTVHVLDLVEERPPPFSPEAVTAEFADILKRYRISRVIGDNYGGDWPKEAMRNRGITYSLSERHRSGIYAAFLPMLNSKRCRLLDNELMRRQILSLERRTAFGGKDTIDHPTNGHDDLANAAAGVLTVGIQAGRGYSILDVL